jgi:hypothetical protein
MPEQRLSAVMGVARGILLLLLAGLLIARRDFAHLNLGDFWPAAHSTPPRLLTYAFVTEITLLALFPLALIRARECYRQALGTTRREKILNAFGWGSCAVMGLMVWGAGHALVALLRGGDGYLIARQSALALYPLVYLYALLFFGDSEKHVRVGVWASIAAALLCALLDMFHLLDPKPVPNGDGLPIYGQETLPIALLGLGLCAVAARTWTFRALAVAGVLFAAWRESARSLQSVVVLGLAGALVFALLAGVLVLHRGQRHTLKRLLLCQALFCVLAAIGIPIKYSRTSAAQQGTETSGEIKGWKLGRYAELMELYENTQAPADASARMISLRPPYVPVSDPEVYKLQAVFKAEEGNVSIRNNIWRFLVWRRMAADWSDRHPVLGAGVGKPWFYPALYHSSFHYGEEREGLDPHNSYLNMLYRYGAVGLALFLAILIATLLGAVRALRLNSGDPLLEGLLLYFGYTLFFAFFTVSLEGPAYSLPFWMALGLIAARARQLLQERSDRPDNA